jgi:hypothetical protein
MTKFWDAVGLLAPWGAGKQKQENQRSININSKRKSGGQGCPPHTDLLREGQLVHQILAPRIGLEGIECEVGTECG